MKSFPLLLSLIPILSSCAYLQSHKNVEMSQLSLIGSLVSAPSSLYIKKQQAYLRLPQYAIQKHYPLVHDSIFRDSPPPHFSYHGDCLGYSFYPISTDTVRVLRNPYGFFSLDVIAKEIKHTTPCPTLSADETLAVKAQIEPSATTPIIPLPHQTENLSFSTQSLSLITFTFVDIPGSVIYNICIPFMAPYYFFKEMASKEKQELFHE